MLLQTNGVMQTIIENETLLLGVVLVFIGILVSLISVPLTKLLTGKSTIEPGNRMVLILKLMGLVLMIVALVLIPISVLPE